MCTRPSLIKRICDGYIKVRRQNIHPPTDLTSRAIAYTNNSLQISFVRPFFLTGTLLVKYDNHKHACVRRAPTNALSAFSWLSIRSRRQQQGSLIWRRGGACALYLWPRSEPGASERLLSAWSVLINIPSSQVMINANPIGCASDENPVSQNEVGLRLPRWSPSHRGCTQSSGEAVPQRSIRHDESGPGGNEGDDFWHGEFKTERPEIMNGGRRSITSLVTLQYKHLNIRWPRRLKCLVFGEYFSFLHGA